MVKITEELLQKADQIPNFSDGVIMPDGDYRLIEEKGHLQTMMALLPYPEKEIWKMIPENDSALFWMIEKTGCVLTDYNSTVGMAMTQSQKEVFDALVARGIISPEYFDITRQRQKIFSLSLIVWRLLTKKESILLSNPEVRCGTTRRSIIVMRTE